MKNIKMKKFMVYLDCGENCFKEIVPALNEKMAREFADGNGRIIKVEDVTDQYTIKAYEVATALENAHFDRKEIDLILRTLSTVEITE